MPSKAEQSVSRSLQMITAELPNGANVSGSEHLQDLFSGLEYYLPEVLRKTHPEWEYESLDGFCPLIVRKTGDAEVEIFGLCIIISDQTLTPIHVFIQGDVAGHEVSLLDCKLGEKGEQGMMRTPWPTRNGTEKLVKSLDGRLGTIEWVYHVEFGTNRS